LNSRVGQAKPTQQNPRIMLGCQKAATQPMLLIVFVEGSQAHPTIRKDLNPTITREKP